MSLASPITGVIDPQWVDSEFSALCTIGHPPLVMTGVLLWVIRRHFSDPAQIVDASLKDYIWNSETEASRIAIESVTKWPKSPTQAIQRRPGIYVKRNRYGRIKLGIGDKHMLGTRSSIDKSNIVTDNAVDNGYRYEVIIAGSHTVFCIGGTGAEAETVGTEVFFELVEFAPLIRKDTNLNRFEVMELGGIGKLEESREHWVVPVVVTYAFNHVWQLTPEALKLKGITLTA